MLYSADCKKIKHSYKNVIFKYYEILSHDKNGKFKKHLLITLSILIIYGNHQFDLNPKNMNKLLVLWSTQCRFISVTTVTILLNQN